MPAIDSCEAPIIRALRKDGWTVIDRPYSVRFQAKGKVFADLRIQNVENGSQIIIVEVKCFPKSSTFLDEFYQAVGQYVFYRNSMQQRNISTPIYLALPHHVFQTFFQEPAIQASINDVRMKLIVVDLESEVIVRWQH